MFPVLFKLGQFVVPSYFAVISLTCSICIYWTAKRSDRIGLPRALAMDTILIVLVAGFVGARAFHILYEYPALYWQEPLRVFRFWEGGFVFFGGLISALLFGVSFLKFKKQDLGPWLDLAAPVAALGYAFGRVGCFLAGCCFGRACTLPWAVVFPPGSDGPIGISVHPTQLYATAIELLSLLILLFIERRPRLKVLTKSGDLFYLWLMLHGLGRILMETFRADYRGQTVLGLSVSTCLSLLLIIIGGFFYLKENKDSQN